MQGKAACAMARAVHCSAVQCSAVQCSAPLVQCGMFHRMLSETLWPHGVARLSARASILQHSAMIADTSHRHNLT